VPNNERYLAFSLAVTQAFLEGSDLWPQFLFLSDHFLVCIYGCLFKKVPQYTYGRTIMCVVQL
jgi:hypothetical protein